MLIDFVVSCSSLPLINIYFSFLFSWNHQFGPHCHQQKFDSQRRRFGSGSKKKSKYFKKHSVITYHFPANSPTAKIVVSLEGKEDSKFVVENANVVETIKKWYLGGLGAVSPSTISSLASTLSVELSK